jgi:hypothetical protein
MLRGSDVEPKSDVIVARTPMKDDDGLMSVQAESQFCFVVDCPSLHIISGNNIRPPRQAETDVRRKVLMYFLLLAQDDLY